MEVSRWCETPPASPHSPPSLITIPYTDTSDADVNSSPAGDREWSDGPDFR